MPQPQISSFQAAVKLLLCVAGIYGAYITQGLFQEKLATERFGPEGARFPHLATLNAFQSWACFLWAYLLVYLLALLQPQS